MAIQVQKSSLGNCSLSNDKNSSQCFSVSSRKSRLLVKYLKSQSAIMWGLAVSLTSLGTMIMPQIAQATTPNSLITSSSKSIIVAQATPEQDSQKNKIPILKNNQTETSANNSVSTIIIRSNIETNPAIAVPQLPSLAVAQNSTNKEVAKRIYTVQAGDTITSIASRHGISAQQIIQANSLDNPNSLAVDRQLVIPQMELAQVTILNSELPSNTISSPSVADTNNVSDPYIEKLRSEIVKLRNQFQNQYDGNESVSSVNSSTKLVNSESSVPNSDSIFSLEENTNNVTPENNSSSEDYVISSAATSGQNYNQLLQLPLGEQVTPQLPPLSPEQYLPDSSSFNGYMWPAQGTLTSGYGWRWGRMHRGIDIAGPIGTPVMAAATGEVISAGWNSGGYGNLVKIQHPDGSVTFYAHNNKLLVSQGQKVRQGEQIAEMGSTGRSTGPHLHFELRPDGSNTINPIASLPKK